MLKKYWGPETAFFLSRWFGLLLIGPGKLRRPAGARGEPRSYLSAAPASSLARPSLSWLRDPPNHQACEFHILRGIE